MAKPVSKNILQSFQRILKRASNKQVVINALMIAAVVGSALNLINQIIPAWYGGKIIAYQIILNYLIPYLVSTYSAVKALITDEESTLTKSSHILESMITCPECGNKKQETMPTDACVFFYQCEQCHNTLKPLKGDCCVFCSYGSVKCPPIQQGSYCCQ